MSNLILICTIAGAVIVAILVIGLILARMYQRASKENAFVRTGVGGQKVVLSGGALVLPVLHEIIKINMNTLKLSVQKKNEEALITKDKMRVDSAADFYLRVKPETEAIANAAQTLGRKTMNPGELKSLLEGKFVDSLRSVAAEMNMDELYEKRAAFVQKVQATVAEDLLKNGMELETVSLTSLDQTDMKYFNPDNAFDAEGLTKLTEIVQSKKKLRNDIEKDTDVQIQSKNLTASKQTLEIQKQQKFLEATQEQQIAVQGAEAKAETEKKKAEQEQIAEEAKITKNKNVQITQAAADRSVQEQKITNEQQIESVKIAKDKAIELANQDRNIAISQKSEEQSKAQAAANVALALTTAAEEKVATAKETEIANRQKTIAVLNAEKNAEQNATQITVEAKAKKTAAVDNAEAIKTIAQAEADAIKIKAEADEKRYAVDAAGKSALNDAENRLAPEIISMRIKLETIGKITAIIEASTKPIESIKDMRVINVEGLNNSGCGGGTGVSSGEIQSGNFSDQLVNSLLRYRTQAPIVDSILKDIGLSGESISGLTKVITESFVPPKSENSEVKIEPIVQTSEDSEIKIDTISQTNENIVIEKPLINNGRQNKFKRS
jgi:uncharacterized membrane protein YqiK